MDTKYNNKLVSVIAPFFNEEDVISKFIERLQLVTRMLVNYEWEIILVDDGSQDRSLEIAKKYAVDDTSIKIVELTRNFGQTPALSAGCNEANGDIIITMDSDLQHFPEEIPLFLEKIEEGYDLVCGWRIDRKEGFNRRYPSRIANYLIKKISKTNIHDFGTTFRAYRRAVINNIEFFGEMHRFLPALVSRQGYRIIEIPIQNIERPAGKSNYTIWRTYGVSLDLLFLFFYLNYLTKPLRIFGILAFLLLVPGFIIALTLILLTYMGVIQGVREHIALLLFSTLLMILGVNFLCYGLIAEVQNRIYYTVKSKNIYNIRKIWGKK